MRITDEFGAELQSNCETTKRKERSYPVPDELPRIGAPATRALAGIGVTRLSQLTEHRAADLRELHGMGPRAIAILRQALNDRKLSLRDDA